MNVLEFINKHFLPLFCMFLGMFFVLFYLFKGNVIEIAFWGIIVIMNQNTLYFGLIKEMLEKENRNDNSRKA